MAQALLETTATKNARLVPVEPQVKSAETCKLFNAGALRLISSSKSTDPTCYTSLTAEEVGLFDNQMERSMERTVALKKLGNILGKKLGYRVDPRAPTKDEREAASAELKAAFKKRNELRAQREARYAAILAADTEYQTLKAAQAEAQKVVDKLGAITRHHKITVGVSESMFFLVKAEGDSWEEVIAKLQTKQAA